MNSKWAEVAERAFAYYSRFGKVNGYGMQTNSAGERAIAIYFETIDSSEEIPKEFESWPVVCNLIGEIKLESKE